MSSRSSLEVRRIGKPDCSVAMLLSAHPFAMCRVQFEMRQSGIRQYSLSTKRWRASNSERERDRRGSTGFTAFSKLEALSIDRLQVYETRNCSPCDQRCLSKLWNEL